MDGFEIRTWLTFEGWVVMSNRNGDKNEEAFRVLVVLFLDVGYQLHDCSLYENLP